MMYDKLTNIMQDIKNNSLPTVSKPTWEEIQEYETKRKEVLKLLYAKFNNKKNSMGITEKTIEMVKTNQMIPVEIEIWIDKIVTSYMEDIPPMKGKIHVIEKARQKIYESKGYQYYTYSEVYPNATID